MITPIRTMTINQIAERKDDLLMSDDDIKELARNVRNKAIDELLNYAETHSFYIRDRAEEIPVVSISMLKVLAEQMKGGAE